MHIEEDSECVADQERSNNGHEDDREIIFMDTSSIPSPLADYHIDLVVEVTDGGEGNYSKHNKPWQKIELCIMYKIIFWKLFFLQYISQFEDIFFSYDF